ncbi:hypothetical protein BN946_scf185042.g10 [Trametes cinnabarina]|uniref:F-box domain-containing protein n=1 Tax=Pycnoporus cinnabarinus TaxID=5643 RepID=A0A060S9P0_PYCCI|nr:hypothetical protein BN946_scf185042.g10 [Trametes cinnabarina]
MSLPRDCLDRLPNDILLDGVMSYLDIFDILRLRRVSVLYYELTHHAAVWKRLLREVDIPLPPLPPSTRHTPPYMSGFEVERLLCRAYSLHRNWNAGTPRCLYSAQFSAHHRVLDMVMVPGGRYLVASVTNRSEEIYSLLVFAIDIQGHFRALAKTDTATKAYDIRAKYVTVRGEQSLAITYLRRDYHHKTDRKKALKHEIPNVSQYSTYYEIDPEVEFRFECIALRIRLAALDELTDLCIKLNAAEFIHRASLLPRPFEYLVCIRSGPTHRLLCPDIEEVFGAAYLAVAKCPNDIILKPIDGGPSMTITCAPATSVADKPHRIRAIKLIPKDNNVFVVREVDLPLTPDQRCPGYLFETFSIIHNRTNPKPEVRSPESRRFHINLGHLAHVYVANPNNPPRSEHSLIGTLPNERSSDSIPPPLLVLAHRVKPESVVYIRLPPKRTVLQLPPTPPSGGAIPQPEQTQITYRHVLHVFEPWAQDVDLNSNVRVLPALRHPLLCLSEWDDITDTPLITRVRALVNKAMHGSWMVEDGNDRLQLTNFEGGPARLNKRVAALAWDETIGRLVVAEPDSETLHIFDFAHEPKLDKHLQRLPRGLRDIPNAEVLLDGVVEYGGEQDATAEGTTKRLR